MPFVIYLVIVLAVISVIAASKADFELEEAVLLGIMWPFVVLVSAIYLPCFVAYQLGLYIKQRFTKD